MYNCITYSWYDRVTHTLGSLRYMFSVRSTLLNSWPWQPLSPDSVFFMGYMHLPKKKRIPSIFKDESTGSCICLRSLIYMSHVNKVKLIRIKMIRIAAIRVNFCLLLLSNGINVGIGHTCNTMRVYHDTIITRATADSFCSLFPYPPTTRAPTHVLT
jgi:hypothetical protein